MHSDNRVQMSFQMMKIIDVIMSDLLSFSQIVRLLKKEKKKRCLIIRSDESHTYRVYNDTHFQLFSHHIRLIFIRANNFLYTIHFVTTINDSFAEFIFICRFRSLHETIIICYLQIKLKIDNDDVKNKR